MITKKGVKNISSQASYCHKRNMRTQKRKLGDEGENLAEIFLLKNNFQILEKNFHTRYGEIDIIARKKNTIHFIEVKTRKTNTYGSLYESISSEKLKKIWRTGEMYLQEKKWEENDFQIDAIFIDASKKPLELEYMENIFL